MIFSDLSIKNKKINLIFKKFLIYFIHTFPWQLSATIEYSPLSSGVIIEIFKIASDPAYWHCMRSDCTNT